MGKGVCGPLPYPPSPPRPEIVELREFPDFFVELSAGVFFSISDLRMSWKRHFWSISGLKKQIFRLRRAYYSSINSDWLQFLQSTRPWFLNSTIQLLLIQQQCNEAERNLSETFKNWKNFRGRYRIPLYSWILVLCQKAGKHCMRLEQLCIAGKALFHK